jgi:hypothetical protein
MLLMIFDFRNYLSLIYKKSVTVNAVVAFAARPSK